MIHETKIHNHPLYPDIERWVETLKNFNDGYELDTFDIYYKVRYEKLGVDVSLQFDHTIKVWRTNNSRTMFKRNLETFEKIPNPNYVEPTEGMIGGEPFLKEPAYDYILSLMKLPISVFDILDMYILDEAADGRFD